MASAVITCVQSALDDLAGLILKPPVRALRFQLRNLKTFLLCSRKLVNDESQLGSLLPWIEDVVRRKGEEIRDDANNSLEVETLEEEIQDWYISMLDRAPGCDLLMSADQLLELMSSILESLVEIYGLRSSNLHFEMLGEAMEGLREQMAFLRCLVQIADPETSGDLMAHAQDVAVIAAYLIFTCRGDEKRKGITFNISCLVQKIKPIDPWVCETYTQVLLSVHSPTRGTDIMKLLLDSLIYILWDILLQLNTPHLVPRELQLQQLYEGLRSLRAVVVDQPVDGGMEEDIGAAVCDAAVFICSLYQTHTDLPPQNLLESINSIFRGLTSYGEPTAASGLQTEEEEFVSLGGVLGKTMESCNEQTTRTSSHMSSTVTNYMIRRRDAKMIVCDQLLGGLRRLQIISIVGMPGIGKTTLALQVYNYLSISNHFTYRAWCEVTQVVDKKKVLLQLLKQIAHDECFEETDDEEYLEMKLWRSLKMHRYLIFLDDVWSIEAWESLKGSFPDDHIGSRIILTSRSYDVAPQTMLAGYGPHILRLLSNEECLDLMQEKLFPEQQGCPPELKDLVISFVDMCKGLPLMVVLVAGILAGTDVDSWKATLDCLISDKFLSEHVFSSVDRSYRHLPDYLKPCFLYFAAFSNDEEVSVRRLLRLWIAEGFVQKDSMQTPEDVAESYLNDLISRSLIMISKRRSDGGIKACRVHDMIRDYCMSKARDGKLLHFVTGYEELSAFIEQPDLRRLRIESKAEHFRESKLFCPHASSLLFWNSSQQTERWVEEEELFLDISFLIRTFKFLHVLDIEQINVGHVFPSELEVLDQLAFVAIRGEMRQIPSSIGNLSKLETLIVDAGTEVVALPDTLGNLLNLQFLYVRSSRSAGGATLPATNLENSSVVQGLGTFCGVVVPSWGILASLMRKFPNIRKLKCRRAVDDDTETEYKSVALEFLSQLQSLHLSSLNACQFKFRLPGNLRKLTLSGFHLVPKKLSVIGKLPNLQVLKLLHVSFEGNTWEMVELGEFWRLRVLKLHSVGLVRWSAWSADGYDFLSCLEKLTLDGCKELEEIPEEALQYCTTLKVIEVYDCSRIIVNMVREIQRDLGNSQLNIVVRDRDDTRRVFGGYPPANRPDEMDILLDGHGY